MDHSAYDVDDRRYASVVVSKITQLAWDISWIDLRGLEELLQFAKDAKEHYKILNKES